MILAIILFVPVCAGLLAWLSQVTGKRTPPLVALTGLAVDFFLIAYLWLFGEANLPGARFADFEVPWFARLGINFHLGMDGLSLILTGLTAFLGCVAVLASWREERERPGFFFLCLTWTLAGVFGVFLAVDLFLFYFAWEFMLVPMFFLIALWGHEDRFRAGVKFFIFTQLSGLLMLAGILGLYFVHGRATGVYTFDSAALAGTPVDIVTGRLLFWGFMAAFLVKLPAVPFHTWLPDAHTQAPTAGSIILAGLLLKTGAYGVFRFALPLFPVHAQDMSTLLGVLGVIGILYGGLLAFSQTDLKRLVAYTSVSHMGFVLLGISIGSRLAFQGAVIEIVAHALSTGALFFLVGALQQRLGTREIPRMGGLWNVMPRLGGATMVFALASLGLPGMGNFVGEFLVVLGAFGKSTGLAVAAALGFIVSTAYSLWMVHRVFFGENRQAWQTPDLSFREMAITILMIIPLLWLGLFPQAFLDLSQKALHGGTEEVGEAIGADIQRVDGGWGQK
jgi:NADH-quinone oxidoreductase subunit M